MNTSAKRLMAALSSAALIVAVLPLALAPGANADIDGSPTEMYPSTITVNRSVDQSTGLVTVGDGERVEVDFNAVIANQGYVGSLLPVTAETTFGISGFAPTLPSGLQAVGSLYQNWNLSPYGAQNCQDRSVQTPTVTLPADACQGYAVYSWRQTVSNNSGADVTWDLPIETAQLSINGTPTAPVLLGGNFPTYRLSLGSRLLVTGDDTSSGVVVSDKDTSWNVSFDVLCLDSTVTNGETLTWEAVATEDGNDMATSGPGLYADWSVPNAPFAGYGAPSTFTATSGSATQAANMSVHIRSFSITDVGKTIAFSLALVDADGNIVSGACQRGGGGNNGGGGGGPVTPVTFSNMSPAGVANATPQRGRVTANRPIASGLVTALENGMGDSAPDPSGGLFFWSTASSGNSITGIVQALGNTGPKAIGGRNSRQLTINLPNMSMLSSFGWYGTRRDRWVALASVMAGMQPTYQVITGSLASQTAVSKPVSVTGLCADGLIARPSVLSAPLATVTLQVRCTSPMNMSTQSTVLARVGGTGATLTTTRIASVGATTAQLPCGYGGIGVNPRAAGAVPAIVVYGSIGASSAPGPNGPGGCSGAGQSARSITTIPANGAAAKTVAVRGTPFGQTDPTLVRMAPGRTPGTWIGFGYTGGGMIRPSLVSSFTVAANGTIASRAARVDTPTGFAASGPMVMEQVEPLHQATATKWVVSRVQTASGENGATNVVTLATYNPATGVMTSGQPLTVSGITSRSSGGVLALQGNHVALGAKVFYNYYGVTAPGKYSAGTWWAWASK